MPRKSQTEERPETLRLREVEDLGASRAAAMLAPTLEDMARHEAGHAVMRWLCGRRATRVMFTANSGLCEGDGERIDPAYRLLIVLAGFAAELGYGFDCARLDLSRCAADDFDDARAIIRIDGQWWPGSPDIDETLQIHFRVACDVLYPHHDLVETIASRLEATGDGMLSARTVAALRRDHWRRVRPDDDARPEHEVVAALAALLAKVEE